MECVVNDVVSTVVRMEAFVTLMQIADENLLLIYFFIVKNEMH